MSEMVEVRLADLPDCWESCGNCNADYFEVVELLVALGDRIKRFEPLLSWEADKAIFELPAPRAGKVLQISVDVGDVFSQEQLLIVLEVD